MAEKKERKTSARATYTQKKTVGPDDNGSILTLCNNVRKTSIN